MTNSTETDGVARRLQGEFMVICDVLHGLHAYPHQLRFLRDFVCPQTNSTSPASRAVATASATTVSFERLCQAFSHATLDDIRCVSLAGSAESPNSEQQRFLRGIWEGARTVVQLYLLKELLANFAVVQILFRLVPPEAEAGIEQQRQTLSALGGLLARYGCTADFLLALRSTTAAAQTREEKLARLERAMPLPAELLHMFTPLLALLSLSPQEMLIVRESLPKMVPAQLFQVVRLRALSSIDTLELQSLLWSARPTKQQQQQQHQQQPEQQQQPQPCVDMSIVKEERGDGEEGKWSPETVFGCGTCGTMEIKEEMSLSAPGTKLHLNIIEQPPERCVYKRNVKPGPTVVVAGGEPGDLVSLYVVPLLYRCDQNTNETRNLSGNAPVDVTPSRVVVFRKLKILVTSHQMSETLFILRFELRRYRCGPGSEYEVIDSVMSTPVNVVSHSTQLRSTSSAAAAAAAATAAASAPLIFSSTSPALTSSSPPTPLPTVATVLSVPVHVVSAQQLPQTPCMASAAVAQVSVVEVVPCNGLCAGGTRVAILGAHFANSPSTRVRFDNAEVVPVFHGPGTLICHTPAHLAGVVSVRVCNVPNVWSDAAVTFTYEVTAPQTHAGPSPPSPGGLALAEQAALDQQAAAEALCEPIVCGNIDVLRDRAAARAGRVDDLDPRGFAAMHYAVVSPSASRGVDAIEVIIRAGGSVNVRDHSGNTPLHWAATTGNEAALAKLLSFGARPQSQNDEGETPLHAAASTESLTAGPCCSALVAAGANVNAQEGSRGETPLHRAAAANNPAAVRALLDHGAHASAQDDDGETPLHAAAAAGARNVIRALLAAGANPNARNTDGETPLQVAAAIGDTALVDLLVGGGADAKVVAAPVLTIAPPPPGRRSRSVTMGESMAIAKSLAAYRGRRQRPTGTLPATSEADLARKYALAVSTTSTTTTTTSGSDMATVAESTASGVPPSIASAAETLVTPPPGNAMLSAF